MNGKYLLGFVLLPKFHANCFEFSLWSVWNLETNCYFSLMCTTLGNRLSKLEWNLNRHLDEEKSAKKFEQQWYIIIAANTSLIRIGNKNVEYFFFDCRFFFRSLSCWYNGFTSIVSDDNVVKSAERIYRWHCRIHEFLARNSHKGDKQICVRHMYISWKHV